MAIIDSLKSKKLPIGVFAGVKKGPSPARIFITLNYAEEFDYLRSYKGFTVKSFNVGTKPVGTIAFEIPVMPPTIDIDTGNQKDTETVARIGEVVLPKYKKARVKMRNKKIISFVPHGKRGYPSKRLDKER